ncbi:MAG: sulfatase-like hydrolase/transferase [Luteolibacter sp.]
MTITVASSNQNGKDSSLLRYSEDIYREEAVKFMTENQRRPFFLYYATPLMHGPIAVKELGEFKDKPAPWTQLHKIWAAEARELDRSVGVLLNTLKTLGLEKDTIVIFTSDNGYAAWGYFNRKAWTDDPVFHNKGPWNRGKFVNANGGVIVPFIAWGPGHIPQGKTDRAICFQDFMQTAGELAGTQPPGPTESVSYLPLLQGRDAAQPLRPLISWTVEGNYGLKIPDDADKEDSQTQYLPPAALLDEKWYALGFRKKPADPLTVRLYDISTDPGCAQDVSAFHPDLRERALAEFARSASTKKKLKPHRRCPCIKDPVALLPGDGHRLRCDRRKHPPAPTAVAIRCLRGRAHRLRKVAARDRPRSHPRSLLRTALRKNSARLHQHAEHSLLHSEFPQHTGQIRSRSDQSAVTPFIGEKRGLVGQFIRPVGNDHPPRLIATLQEIRLADGELREIPTHGFPGGQDCIDLAAQALHIRS